MAANLLYLKSRSLLPVDLQLPDEEAEDDDPRWDLIRQLIEYKKFKEAAALLQDRALQQENIFDRTGVAPSQRESRLQLGEVGIFQLINAFQNAIKRVEARQELQEIFGENFTVSDKIEAILLRVSEGATLKFSDLFAAMQSRVEIVVTFLALLELMRLKQVRATQSDPFGEIEIAAAAKRDDQSYREVYGNGAANLIASFPRARLIFTSSTSVYAQRDGSWVSEESPAEPLTERGKILRQAENNVLDHGGVVLRLAGIYGPGRSFLLRSIINRAPSASGNDRFVNQA